MAEFAMVSVLLLLLFLALVTVGLWAYARTLLTSAAAQAARYAANADVPDAVAADRARALLSGSVAGGTAGTVRCSWSADGLLVEVTCTMRAPGPVALLDGVLPDITVTGHSLREER
ncbi:TadE/TadG family type IV pilus assembly protein [Nakamurella endophytica]|uniref:TadE-like domain-containing protein n=1 Tax=Nakamurella endophytica TaxID=1748367 RepID=A0A917T3A6_9ACTN|nr:TadE/TadG family type IV pilus assembly protein [Nakamurella endophytica]GGM07746.1 hypothetical protein GCM10011594_29620 [Nakamurella endophytica]